MADTLSILRLGRRGQRIRRCRYMRGMSDRLFHSLEAVCVVAFADVYYPVIYLVLQVVECTFGHGVSGEIPERFSVIEPFALT